MVYENGEGRGSNFPSWLDGTAEDVFRDDSSSNTSALIRIQDAGRTDGAAFTPGILADSSFCRWTVRAG